MNHLLPRTPSPSKRRKRQDTDIQGNDAENTARPFNPTALLSLRDDASQHSTSSARSSATSPRSRSPTKRISDMLFAPQPIVFKQFVPRGPAELPSDLNTILNTIERRFSRGIAVVSDAYRNAIEGLADETFGAIDDFAYTKPIKLPGPSPAPEQCAKAVLLAQRCEEGGHCEAAWNSSVHNFILDLALHHNVFKEKLYFLNCTSTWISPPSLNSPGQAGTMLNFKMVNFAIHIEPSECFRKALRERAQRSALPMSANHTLHEPLRWRPICVSIETKHTSQIGVRR
ncbi:hypothetical protein M501DRAFT_1044332 [Patellaria atrata CBS 101060]|uniref:PD-(D/E)XK nuclease-like domain-containing protein n=1 Tax=Patellaria atrata CBS 101060 TaxID=1346257 RepID=A0A9P4VN42_9PEZI|nr:hypothetical protein M501DRAFT_1044332 [Patellaria atrata CBS 101060]